MSNIRIIYDNAADRATLAGSTTAGNLGVDNLKSDIKAKVCRSTSTSLNLRAAWPSLEAVGAVVCTPTNLSPSTTVRVRVTREPTTTNRITGSQTLSSTHGWSGSAAVSSPGVNYKGNVPYVTVRKTTSSANESRTASFGAVAANTTITFTAAIRAGTVTEIGMGLYDGSSWGVNGDATAEILEGPGNFVQGSGALFGFTDLSTTVDTLVKITRRYTTAATGSVSVFPGRSASTTVGHSGLITRLQVEVGDTHSSYYPTTTTSATRPLGYMDSWQTYDYDSGSALFCPAPSVQLRGYTAAQSASAYAYGGGTYASIWIPRQDAYGVAIDIVDTNNLQGYVEVSKLVVGDYWEPSFGVEQENTNMTLVDMSEQFRTDSGDMHVTVKPKHRKQTLSMPSLNRADQEKMWEILWSNGVCTPIFLSLYPENPNKILEQKHMLYGRLVASPVMSTPYFSYMNATLDIEEV